MSQPEASVSEAELTPTEVTALGCRLAGCAEWDEAEHSPVCGHFQKVVVRSLEIADSAAVIVGVEFACHCAECDVCTGACKAGKRPPDGLCDFAKAVWSVDHGEGMART